VARGEARFWMLARTMMSVKSSAGTTQSKTMIAQIFIKLIYVMILADAMCRVGAVPKWDISSRLRLA
jgi:hypothetical protein